MAIQNFFLKGTHQYKAVFPNGRKPFSSGTVDDRINSFNVLALNMTPYPELNNVREEVIEVYSVIDAAREVQQGSKGSVKVSSTEVETARLAAMVMQYRNLGFAMDAYSTNPEFIGSLFDLEALRSKDQKEFTGTLNPSENEAVLIHTFGGTNIIRLRSNGNAAIRFYLASTPNGINSDFAEVSANEEKTITASHFNVDDLSTHRYLTAVNQSVSETTQYLVEIG